MGIFWFGQAATLDDIKEKDLKKERQRLQVSQRMLSGQMRDAQARYDGLDSSSDEPGLSGTDLDDIAYEMELAEKAVNNAENDRQQILSKLMTVDLLLDLFKKRKDLEANGIWRIVGSVDPDRLQEQLGDLMVAINGGNDNINNINAILGITPDRVVANRSSAFRRIRERIGSRRFGSG